MARVGRSPAFCIRMPHPTLGAACPPPGASYFAHARQRCGCLHAVRAHVHVTESLITIGKMS